MSSVRSARCCTPGAVVVVEVLGDLALAPAFGRFVDRLHDAVAVPHHGRSQRGELGRDRVLVEVLQLAQPPHARVPVDPLRQPAVLDVGDDVVVAREADGRAERERAPTRLRTRAGTRRGTRRAPRACAPCRRRPRSSRSRRHRGRRATSAGDSTLTPPRATARAMRLACVGDAVRDDAHAVAVAAHVLGDVGGSVERARDDEADLALRRARTRRGRAGRSRGRRRR